MGFIRPIIEGRQPTQKYQSHDFLSDNVVRYFYQHGLSPIASIQAPIQATSREKVSKPKKKNRLTITNISSAVVVSKCIVKDSHLVEETRKSLRLLRNSPCSLSKEKPTSEAKDEHLEHRVILRRSSRVSNQSNASNLKSVPVPTRSKMASDMVSPSPPVVQEIISSDPSIKQDEKDLDDDSYKTSDVDEMKGGQKSCSGAENIFEDNEQPYGIPVNEESNLDLQSLRNYLFSNKTTSLSYVEKRRRLIKVGMHHENLISIFCHWAGLGG